MAITEKEILRAKIDRKYREKLVTDNSDMVWSIVNRRIKVLEQQPTAFQEGMIGFLEGITGFDPSTNNGKPETYLFRRINNQIDKFLIGEFKNGVIVDWRVLYYVNRKNGKKTEFLTKSGDWVTSTKQKVSELVKIPKGEHKSIYGEFVSTENVCANSGKSFGREETFGERLTYKDEKDQSELCEAKEYVWFLKDFFAVSELSNKHKKCVIKYLGLKDGSPKTFKEVGEEMECSKQFASKLYNELMNSFKKYLIEKKVTKEI